LKIRFAPIYFVIGIFAKNLWSNENEMLTRPMQLLLQQLQQQYRRTQWFSF